MESILSLPKNCMVFLRIIPVKKVDEVHRIVYNTESAERISVTVHTGVNSNKLIAACVQRDFLVNDKNHEEAANGSFF